MTTGRRNGLALLIALCLAAAPAVAQPPQEGQPPQAQAGRYTLSGVSEGDPVCKVRLGTGMAIGGWSLTLARDCYGKFGLSRDIAAWTVYPNGDIAFIDPLRKPLVRFAPVQAGGYVGDGPNGRPISLDREVKGPPPTVQEQLSGQWSLNRFGGTVACRFAMTSNRTGTAGTLRALPGCAARWGGAVRWERAKGRIRLLDAKGRVLLVLPGDPIQGFDGEDARGEGWALVRDWD